MRDGRQESMLFYIPYNLRIFHVSTTKFDYLSSQAEAKRKLARSVGSGVQ